MGFLATLQDGATKLILWGHAHSAALYTAVGVSSGLGAIISGIAVTPENTRRLDNERDERARIGAPEMTFWEKARMIGPSYIPCVLLFGTSATCFILNTLREERKIATLAGLYSMSEKSFEEYRDKVKDMFGERKESKVRDEVAADHAKNASNRAQMVVMTGHGTYPVLIDKANILMYSSIQRISEVKADIVKELNGCMYMSLEEVLGKLDAPMRKYDTGEYIINFSEIGWNVEDDFDFFYTYAGGDNGEPTLVLNWSVPPHEDFRVRGWRPSMNY